MQAEDIPQYVDSQMNFFFWEFDELIPMVLLLALGILFKALLICLGLMVGVGYLYRRFKNESLEGVLLHIGYWNGIYTLSKKHENGFIRELIE